VKLFTLLCLVLGSVICTAQKPDWNIDVDEEIMYPQLSTNGNYLVYYVDRDEHNVECINVKTGAKIWSKTLADFSDGFSGHFIDNETFLLGNQNRYEFVRTSDGSIAKTLPIIGESWDDDYLGTAATPSRLGILEPYYVGNMGIFYFEDGFQILDLKKQSVIHQSECTSRIGYEKWENMLLLVASGCDSIYVLDTTTSKMVFKMEMGSGELNDRVLQHFVVYKDQMFLFNEDNILSIDLKNQSVAAILPVAPDDPDMYLTVPASQGLYLLTSMDDKQMLYDGRTASLLWETKEGEIPGLADQIRLYDNDRTAVMITYQEDGKVGAYKIDMKTGKLLWSRLLFEQDGSYVPGHLKASKTGSVIGAIALSTAMNMLSGPNSRTRYRPNWAALDAGLYKEKQSDGYTYFLDTANTDRVTLVMGGQIYTELKKTARDTYDGEGIVILDIKDGSVVKHEPRFIIAESDKEGDYNAVRFMTVSSHRTGDIIVGSRDIYIVHKSDIQHFAFDPKNDQLNYMSRLDSSIAVSVNHADEWYDYWIIDITSHPAHKTLCARSVKKNFVMQDTLLFQTRLYYNDDGELLGYPLTAGDVTEANLSSAAWKLSEDDLDEMEIGSLEENVSVSDSIQGIRVSGNSIFLMGDDALGKVSFDGKCRWSHVWWPQPEKTRLGLTEVGSYLVYSSGAKTVILDSECNKSTVVGEHTIVFDDVRVLTDKAREIVVLDVSDGKIFGYHSK
jgi:outer membrane protein assembly factor BamB